jgi:hypothetical protein
MARGSKPGERRGGRKKGSLNKATADIKALAQTYTSEAMERLAVVMRTSDSDAARVAAIKEIFERGHGKAPQPQTGEGGTGPIAHVHRIELVDLR